MNETAARVTRPSSSREPDFNKIPGITFDTAPPTFEPNPRWFTDWNTNGGGLEDYRGTRRGRLEIIGFVYEQYVLSRDPDTKTERAWGDCPASAYFSNKPPTNKRIYLLGRCDCGKFEIRRIRSWRRNLGSDQPDMCQYCDRRDHLRRKAHFSAYGYWPNK